MYSGPNWPGFMVKKTKTKLQAIKNNISANSKRYIPGYGNSFNALIIKVCVYYVVRPYSQVYVKWNNSVHAYILQKPRLGLSYATPCSIIDHQILYFLALKHNEKDYFSYGPVKISSSDLLFIAPTTITDQSISQFLC